MYNDVKPGSGERGAPDIVTKDEDGNTAIWFKHKDATPPEDWDVCVPHNSQPGWVVYFLYLGGFTCILLAGAMLLAR